MDDIALNEARLIVENKDKGSAFRPVEEIALFYYSDDDKISIVTDQLEGTEYFGGFYDESSGRTEFRLTQQLQRTLTNDTISPRFYLGVSGASILPNRMICNGSDPFPDGSGRLKLELIFSKLNNQ